MPETAQLAGQVEDGFNDFEPRELQENGNQAVQVGRVDGDSSHDVQRRCTQQNRFGLGLNPSFRASK